MARTNRLGRKVSAIKQWVPDDIETGQEEVATTIEAPPQKGSDSSKTKVTPEATGTDTGTDPGTPEATEIDIAQMTKKLSEQRKRKRKMTYDQRFKKKNVAIEMELVRLIDAESGGERGEVKRIFNTALRMYYGLPLKGYEDE